MALITDIFSVFDPFFIVDEGIADKLNLSKSPDDELYSIHLLNGEKCKDKAGFMKEANVQFHFPDYFGFNWDAFFDSFSGFLYNIKQTHFLLAFSNADDLFTEDNGEIEALLEYLQMSVNEVRNEAYNMDFKVAFLVKDATQSHLGFPITQNDYQCKVIRASK